MVVWVTDTIPEPPAFESLIAEDIPDEPTIKFTRPDARAHGRARRAWANTQPKGPRGSSRPKVNIVRAPVPNVKGQFVKPIARWYGMVAMGIGMRDPKCGMAIMQQAEACAKAWDELAYKNDAVRRVLYGMMQTGMWGEIFVAHMPIIMTAAMHHVPAMQNLEEMFANMGMAEGGDNAADGPST
jgi:hypothetical protein